MTPNQAVQFAQRRQVADPEVVAQQVLKIHQSTQRAEIVGPAPVDAKKLQRFQPRQRRQVDDGSGVNLQMLQTGKLVSGARSVMAVNDLRIAQVE